MGYIFMLCSQSLR